MREHMSCSSPVIITNAMSDWPAMSKWNMTYLKRVAGHRTVPIELFDEGYMDEGFSTQLMRLSDFIDRHITSSQDVHPAKATLPRAYLAQHQLFDQIPRLSRDVLVPDYCCCGNDDADEPVVNAWFGPKGTKSNLHHDGRRHNLLAQVMGKKYVRLYPKSMSDKLYPHDGKLSNTSRVDVEADKATNARRFPDFSEASYVECTLSEGEMLYIPPFEWHYIRAMSDSFSVSFWW